MNWRIEVDKSVSKVLKSIPHTDAARLLEVLEEFTINPFAGDIVKLGGEENSWRRRVGAYRIFFEIFSEQRVILIQEIQRRSSHTYR